MTYETQYSRKTFDLPAPESSQNADERPPHGAGSYHDPEQHRILLDRVDALNRDQRL